MEVKLLQYDMTNPPPQIITTLGPHRTPAAPDQSLAGSFMGQKEIYKACAQI